MARKRVKPTLQRFMVDGHNPETGDLDVSVIYLWKTKAGIMKKNNVGGALASGTEIEIIRRDGDWFYIKADVKHNGLIYPQSGYVKKSLIKPIEES